ncbi:Hypothetical predicted protein [Paramuricea clavata]|uniref:Uncharacterized protein n=1 Tax=Paramuricea clavata TaxID=317549 RepID=A0A6S7GV48_PARCT|nr:Hypothetical predicted protein [Paramuricea clavata]
MAESEVQGKRFETRKDIINENLSNTHCPTSCSFCGSLEPKYRCPRCDVVSCSLACVKKHKVLNSCSGQRDKTKYVAKREYNEKYLLNDYRFLEEASRVADNARRDHKNKQKFFSRNKYSTPREFAVFPVLGGLCPSSSKNDKETLEDNNKTPPKKKRFSDRNADGRFGHFRNKNAAALKESREIWAKVSAAELRSFEYSEWNIKAVSRRIRRVVVYRIPYSDIHPISTSIFFDGFANFLESAVLCTDQLLMTGDFNIHVDVTDDVDAVKLQELLESTGLQQHVNVPTHIRGHTLDLIITKHSENIVTSPPRTDYLFSDHMPVHCNLLVNKPCLKKTHISYKKVKSINVDALRNDLSNSDLCKNMLSMELNDLVDCYNHTLSSSFDRHVHVNRKTVVKRPTVPWFNEEVKLAKRARRRAEKKWRRTKLYSDFLVYKPKKNQATFVMKRARNQCYTTFIQQNSSDRRKLFKSAKFLFNQETDFHFPEYCDNTVLANDIRDFFAKKIDCIRQELDSATTYDNPTSEPQIMPNVQLDSFKTLTEDDVNRTVLHCLDAGNYKNDKLVTAIRMFL